MDALREHLGASDTGVKDDQYIVELAYGAIWLAEKVSNDLDALLQNADEAATYVMATGLSQPDHHGGRCLEPA